MKNKADIKMNISRGLSDVQVEESRAEHGTNNLSVGGGKSFLRHFFENLGDPVIKILLAALVINLIFVFKGGDWVETLGIAISVFLATFISTVSERGSEAAFKRLSEECDKSSYRVRRNGIVREIPIGDIVVGDVVIIGAGEKIPSDGFILNGKLSVDQSAMTGETKEVEKYKTRDNNKTPASRGAVFRGCLVLSGEAEFVTFSVGDKTFLGEISKEVQLSTRESPLKVRLAKLAKQISRLGYFAALLVALAYLFNAFVIESGFDSLSILLRIRDLPYLFENLLHAFMLGLTVIVVAVPEGLPMMIAVVLSSNIKKMVRDNVLVRKPVGIESAGSMNILFTDKTGTLTEGKLGVGKIIMAHGKEFSSFKDMKKAAKPAAALFCLSCHTNTSASLSDGNVLGGNATDRALLESLSGDACARGFNITGRILFDSSRKYSAVSLSGKENITLIKGAPEKLLPNIKYCLDENRNTAAFSQYEYTFRKRLNELTNAGERVILIAEADSLPEGERFGELTLICAVMLSDKIRFEAKNSVSELRGAGIQVVMITGDNKDTANSIAKSTGIIGGEKQLVLTSDDLAAMSDLKIKEILPTLAVVARALPQDKSRLVRIAQEKGLVVGMTGDGINDAPALKRADIGFAMGTGTQVAKDAGDIIILDNKLTSIAKAVLYGRNIFKSIRKFITLQLTMNFCAVGISMIGPFIGIDAPVTVVQMLWINIIMDTLGGLAFAGEAPNARCMKEKPKKRDEPILNRYMVNQILFLGTFTVGLCIAFLKYENIFSHFRQTEDNLCHLSAFFALFIFTSIFNCFNARTDRLRLFDRLSANKAFIFIMFLVMSVQILFIYLGGSVLRTMPLTQGELIFTMLLSLLVFPADLIRKVFWKIRGNKTGF